MSDYAYTVFSCIGFLLCIPAAYFNWKVPGRPWATLILIGWVFAINLLSFIDSIIWGAGDPDQWWDGQVYCDIDSHIKSAFPLGVPGATIGICRFLAAATNPDPGQKALKYTQSRRNIIDLFLGLLLPILHVPIKFIISPRRYYIIGIGGCTGWTDDSWPSIPLYYLWSPILTLVASGYAGIHPLKCASLITVVFLRHWWIRRQNLNSNWAMGQRSGISRLDFIRLVATVLSVVFLYLPLSLYILGVNLAIPLHPFSWSRIHGPFWNVIEKVASPTGKAEWEAWIGPVLAITSFFFVGFTRPAKQFYERCMELTYDYLPKNLQKKFPNLQKLSEKCKERRSTQGLSSNTERASIRITDT